MFLVSTNLSALVHIFMNITIIFIGKTAEILRQLLVKVIYKIYNTILKKDFSFVLEKKLQYYLEQLSFIFS